jgi:hypothetical protein
MEMEANRPPFFIWGVQTVVRNKGMAAAAIDDGHDGVRFP